jgi:hypothetical protein
MKTRVGLVPNPNYDIKKTKKKTKTQHMWNKIQQTFIVNKKQKQNKVMIRKCTQNWCWTS